MPPDQVPTCLPYNKLAVPPCGKRGKTQDCCKTEGREDKRFRRWRTHQCESSTKSNRRRQRVDGRAPAMALVSESMFLPLCCCSTCGHALCLGKLERLRENRSVFRRRRDEDHAGTSILARRTGALAELLLVQRSHLRAGFTLPLLLLLTEPMPSTDTV